MIRIGLLLKNSFVIILLAVALIRCDSRKYLSPEEINKFVADEANGLVQKAELNGYAITVTYRPTDLWIYQETGSLVVDTAAYSALNKKYKDYYYFILSLSKNNKEALHQVEGGMGQYSELVQTMSFRMGEFVNLTTSAQDTIPTGDFMLNRTYGLSDATNLLFVFNKEKAKGREWVQFNLNEFGLGVGNQRFRFRTEDLEYAPKIKFEIE
ncbi:MAG: hypothetical protein ACOYXT_13300 [Bacteroidota bacterium]